MPYDYMIDTEEEEAYELFGEISKEDELLTILENITRIRKSPDGGLYLLQWNVPKAGHSIFTLAEKLALREERELIVDTVYLPSFSFTSRSTKEVVIHCEIPNALPIVKTNYRSDKMPEVTNIQELVSYYQRLGVKKHLLKQLKTMSEEVAERVMNIHAVTSIDDFERG